ncbi:MAG: hypothetical protein AAGI51_04860 [Pseudomonadota bacterium]
MHGYLPLFLFAAVGLASAASIVSALAPPPDPDAAPRAVAFSAAD